MNTYESIINDGTVFLDRKGISSLLGVSNSTVTAYLKKGMEEGFVEGGKTYFDAQKSLLFKQRSIKTKHSQEKPADANEIDMENIEGITLLPDGRSLSDLDLSKQKDIEILSAHPVGAIYLENMKIAKDIEKKEEDLKIKRGQYLLVEELDISLSEILALISNALVSMRDQLPISQTEDMIAVQLAKKVDMQQIQKILSEKADKTFEMMFQDINESMLKRAEREKIDIISFLENLLKLNKELNTH